MADIPKAIYSTQAPTFVPAPDEHAYFYHAYWRFFELITQIFLHVFRLTIHLGVNKLKREKWRTSWQALLGQSIADLCASLGATFIKMGQIMSTRCDLFPAEFIAPLIKLQDHMQPFAFHHVPEIILAQTGQPLTEIFAAFEEQAVSSASIASVYRARLHDGQWVAVKVRRPDIVRKVREDLRLMRFMSKGLARLPAMRLVPVIEMVNDLGHCIEQQLDLRIEAQNNRRFREQFAQNPQVKIPILVDAYCTEALLVMEFMEDLVRIDELDWEEDEYRESLTTALNALYHMIFTDGFIHCDLHPGNMYLRKEGQVVILDTGFVARLENIDRYQFAEFFLGIATNDGKRCANIIYATALYRTDRFDQEGFEQEVIELISRSSGSKAANFQVAAFVFHVFDIQRRFGLRSSTSFTMALVSLLVFEGMAKQLYPHLDFQMAARPFLFKALLQRRAELSAQV